VRPWPIPPSPPVQGDGLVEDDDAEVLGVGPVGAPETEVSHSGGWSATRGGGRARGTAAARPDPAGPASGVGLVSAGSAGWWPPADPATRVGWLLLALGLCMAAGE